MLLILTTACTIAATPSPVRIALLAPFEGRYREVGYNALYAARLALQDADTTRIELLPIDDGGTSESAANRARALYTDSQVHVVLLLGFDATDTDTLLALGDIPALVVGNWDAQPIDERIFVLSNPNIDDLLTIPARTAITEAAQLDGPFTGGDMLALAGFGKLSESPDNATVISSATLPDSDFRQRYRNSDQFAPEPGLLASLTYDATYMVVDAILASGNGRGAVREALSSTVYNGLNGMLRFENGYWANAPVYSYQYDVSGQLLPIDGVVE